MIIKRLKGLLGFFTIIPVGMESIETTSEYFFLCPVVGLIIGSIAGVGGWASEFFLPQIVAGGVVLASIQIVTGFHHFDGLLDFSDAVMVRGEPKKRLKVMHDKYTGAAAVAAGFIVLALTGLSFGYFSGVEIIKAAIVSEIMAKETMVLTAYLGKKPSYKGMGYYMVESMKKKHLKSLFSVALSAAVVFPLVKIRIVYLFITVAIMAAILSSYANKNFEGVTGDVLGATNETTRMISLLVILATVS